MAISIRRKLNTGLLAAAMIAAGLGLGMTTANATTITASVGGVPTSADCYVNFDSLSLGNASGTATGTDAGGNPVAACSIGVSFSPDGQVVKGASSGNYAAPVLSNSNGVLFGDPENQADTTKYLTAGGTATSNATLSFASPEMYLGLLWGSVDSYNTITFWLGGSQVASFGGNAVSAAAGGGNCANGNQATKGTCYVNINLSTAFDTVVMTSSQHAFEFDNVAFSSRQLNVPEPGETGLFLLGLLLIGSGYWYQKRKTV